MLPSFLSKLCAWKLSQRSGDSLWYTKKVFVQYMFSDNVKRSSQTSTLYPAPLSLACIPLAALFLRSLKTLGTKTREKERSKSNPSGRRHHPTLSTLLYSPCLNCSFPLSDLPLNTQFARLFRLTNLHYKCQASKGNKGRITFLSHFFW